LPFGKRRGRFPTVSGLPWPAMKQPQPR
jgi:hypothetical protein